jgi:hypothetical protein
MSDGMSGAADAGTAAKPRTLRQRKIGIKSVRSVENNSSCFADQVWRRGRPSRSPKLKTNNSLALNTKGCMFGRVPTTVGEKTD